MVLLIFGLIANERTIGYPQDQSIKETSIFQLALPIENISIEKPVKKDYESQTDISTSLKEQYNDTFDKVMRFSNNGQGEVQECLIHSLNWPDRLRVLGNANVSGFTKLKVDVSFYPERHGPALRLNCKLVIKLEDGSTLISLKDWVHADAEYGQSSINEVLERICKKIIDNEVIALLTRNLGEYLKFYPAIILESEKFSTQVNDFLLEAIEDIMAKLRQICKDIDVIKKNQNKVAVIASTPNVDKQLMEKLTFEFKNIVYNTGIIFQETRCIVLDSGSDFNQEWIKLKLAESDSEFKIVDVIEKCQYGIPLRLKCSRRDDTYTILNRGENAGFFWIIKKMGLEKFASKFNKKIEAR